MLKKLVFISLLFFLNSLFPSSIMAEETIDDLLYQMETESEEILSFSEERLKDLKRTLNQEKAEYEEKKYAMGYLQVVEEVAVNAELGSVLEDHIGAIRANFGMVKYANTEYIKKIENDISNVEFAIRYANKYKFFGIIMEHLVDTDFFENKELLERLLKEDVAPLKELGDRARKIKKNWQLKGRT